MGRMGSLALLLCLIACTGTAQWSRDGVSSQTAAQDLSACRHGAQEATRRDADIDTDILETRGHDWQRTGVLDTKRATFALQNRSQNDDYVARCMVGKGYSTGE